MRFCIGKVAPNEEFHPDRGGWRKLREPNFLTFYVLALPVTAVTFVALTIAIGSVGDESAKIVIKPGDVTTGRVVVGILLGFLFFFSALAVHEFVHLLAHPRCGLSNDSVVGIWPTRGVAYAHYDGEITRNRFLFVIALPFVVLSLVPVAFFYLSGHVNMFLAVLALFNGIGSCFDVLVFVMTLIQLPRNAVLRNKGWDTYWRPQTAS
jgi:Putative zincin peptidase